MSVAAIQLEAAIGDVDANLAACQRLADTAAREGAEWIILPEFFSTGMGFFPELSQHSLPPDGPVQAEFGQFKLSKFAGWEGGSR